MASWTFLTIHARVLLLVARDPGVRLRDIAPLGKKTIINLWATWCEPCVKEMPQIVKNVARLESENTQVVLVSYDEGVEEKIIAETKAWFVSQKIEMTTFHDFENQILGALRISALPYTIGVGADGKIQWMEMGELDWDSSKISVHD